MSYGNTCVTADFVIPRNDTVVRVPSLNSTSATVHNFINLTEDTCDVESYGAVGDGITDDTVAIQNAIDNHRHVIFGNGKTYRLTAALLVPSNTVIDLNNCTITQNDGTAVDNWIIPGTGSATVPSPLPAQCPGARYYNFYPFYLDGVSNVIIRHGTLYGTLGCVRLSSPCSYCQIDGLTCNYNKTCLRIDGNTGFNNLRFENLDFKNTQLSSIGFNGQSSTTAKSVVQDVVFKNIKMYNFGTWAMVSLYTDNMIFDNVAFEYDSTYASFLYGASTDTSGNAISLVPWQNKRGYDTEETKGFYATGGWYITEHAMYVYSNNYGTFRNCIISNSRNLTTDTTTRSVASKLVSCTDLVFDNCRIYQLYDALPNTYYAGSTNTCGSHIMLSNCLVESGINSAGYTTRTRHRVDAVDCTFRGSNMLWGSGGFADANWYKFSNCIFEPNGTTAASFTMSLAPAATYTSSMDMSYNGCSFYGLADNPVFQQIVSGVAAPTMNVMFNACKFFGLSTATDYESVTTNPGLLVTNAGTALNFLAYEVKNCEFFGCNGVQATPVNNIQVTNCILDQKLDVNYSDTVRVKYAGCRSRNAINPFTLGERAFKFTGEGDSIVTEVCGNPTLIDSASVGFANDVIAAGLFTTANKLDFAAGTGSTTSATSTGTAYLSGEYMRYTDGAAGDFTIDDICDLKTRGSMEITYAVNAASTLTSSQNLMSLVGDSVYWGLSLIGYQLYFRNGAYTDTGTAVGSVTTAGGVRRVQVNWDNSIPRMNLYLDGVLKFTTTQTAPTSDMDELLIGAPEAPDLDFMFKRVTIWGAPRRLNNNTSYTPSLDDAHYPELNVQTALNVTGYLSMPTVPEFADLATAVAAIGYGRVWRVTDTDALLITHA